MDCCCKTYLSFICNMGTTHALLLGGLEVTMRAWHWVGPLGDTAVEAGGRLGLELEVLWEPEGWREG